MLEIAVLFFGTRHLSKVARQRGHSAWFAALLPVLWIGAEFTGAFIGVLLLDDMLAGVGMGLVGAIVGGIAAAVTVYNLPMGAVEDVGVATGVNPGSVNDNVWAG